MNVESTTELKLVNDNKEYNTSLSISLSLKYLKRKTGDSIFVIPYLEFETSPLGNKGYKSVCTFHKNEFLKNVWSNYEPIYRRHMEVIEKKEYMYQKGYELLRHMYMKKNNLDYLLWLLGGQKPLENEDAHTQYWLEPNFYKGNSNPLGVGVKYVTHYLPKRIHHQCANDFDEKKLKEGYNERYSKTLDDTIINGKLVQDRTIRWTKYVTPAEYKKRLEGWYGTFKYNPDTVYLFVLEEKSYVEYWNGEEWVEPKVVKKMKYNPSYNENATVALAIPSKFITRTIEYGDDNYVSKTYEVTVRQAYYIKGEDGNKVNLFKNIINYEPLIDKTIDKKESDYKLSQYHKN